MNRAPVISARAKASLDRMMVLGLRHGIAGGAPGVDIQAIDHIVGGSGTHMVVLTIASYTFRIITALHFEESAPMKAHMAQIGQRTPESMTHQDFIDAICESGNMCSGTLNRELGVFYDGLGLSTPQILDIQSLPHLDHLGAQHLQHFRVDTADGLRLHASLCARAYEPMDFEWKAEEQPVSTGELELF